MVMGSISHLNSQTTKFLNYTLCIKSKPPSIKSHLRFQATPTLLQVSSKLSLSSIPQIPTSNLPKRNVFAKSLCNKVLVSVIGAFIFMGSFGFNTRTSLALSAEESKPNADIEEKRDTQMEDSENEEMYEQILDKEPRNVEALKVIVYSKMRRGKTKQCLKYVERLIQIEPEEIEWRLLEAMCYEMMGRFSTAKRLYKDILEERPLLLRALHGLAMVMHKNYEGSAVFDTLNKALEVARREKRAVEERSIRILIAQMHVVKGQLEDGLKKFQDLVNENPRDFRPYLCQGVIYSLLDKKEEAEQQFETYTRLVPDEFPQRGFLDDVVLAAKTETSDQFRTRL